MCGIAGVFAHRENGRSIDRDLISRMRDTLTHRGPDGAGTWVDETRRIGLGHRRLAIVDLSPSAAQPMVRRDGSLVLSFNGEIYNHAELRKELASLGHNAWQTDHSDTEVLLEAFAEWGIGCLDRLRGMFAFAMWDTRSRELWLVRDRFGIKPLYWTEHHGVVAFASEIKAILDDPEVPRAIDKTALYHYLSFLATPAPTTLFAGIRKLPAGSLLRVREGSTPEERAWYDVWDHTKPLVGIAEDELAHRVRDELRASVQLHKASDVPIGVLLSGGIDSSTNAALFSEGETRPVRTFTIGYDQDYGSYKNEFGYARRVARFVGAEHHEKALTLDDLLGFVPQMARMQDEPIADPVCVPLYFVSKLARESGVTVCQVGEGADELFCGYPSWRRAIRVANAVSHTPRIAMDAAFRGLNAVGRGKGTRSEWLRRGAAGLPTFWGGAEAFTETEKASLVGGALATHVSGLTSWDALRPTRARFEEKAWDRSPLHWMTYLDLQLRLPELLLMRVDKMAMGTSIEARVPFLDHVFVELALSIPAAAKTEGGVLKRILKHAVKGLVPKEVIDRPKQGFGVPIYEWFKGRLAPAMRESVHEFCRTTDLIDARAARAVLNGKNDAHAWYLFNLAMWWKAYVA
jgi:asparagine synthase (glutamine-hydrolysing)